MVKAVCEDSFNLLFLAFPRALTTPWPLHMGGSCEQSMQKHMVQGFLELSLSEGRSDPLVHTHSSRYVYIDKCI